MKILIVAEYVRRFPWSGARWCADLGAALVSRGHDVTIACDGLEDPSFFEGLRVVIRRPHRTWRGSDPLGFQSWAISLSGSSGADATISLTPLVPGDLWAPVTLGAAALVGHLLLAHSPVSALLELAARPWLPLSILAETRAAPWTRDGRRPVMARLGRLSCGGATVPLGYASRLAPMNDESRQASRDAVRGLLGLSDDRRTILISAIHPYRPGLAGFLRGFMLARGDLRDHAPFLLVMGRRTVPVHNAARDAGATRFVRFLGATSRPELALAATDLAAAPWSASGGIGTGRFVADALRLSVPVLAAARAPGAELIRPEHFGTSDVGMVISDASAEGWRRAIVQYLSPESGAYAKRAARDAGAVLSMDGMAARVERALGEWRT